MFYLQHNPVSKEIRYSYMATFSHLVPVTQNSKYEHFHYKDLLTSMVLMGEDQQSLHDLIVQTTSF